MKLWLFLLGTMPLGLISWYDRVIKLYSGNTADYSVKKLAFLRYAQSCPWNKASLPMGQPILFLRMAMQKRAGLLTWYYTCQVIPLSEIVGHCCAGISFPSFLQRKLTWINMLHKCEVRMEELQEVWMQLIPDVGKDRK